MSLRCRRCLPCKTYLKEHRRAQVLERLQGCHACSSDDARTRCAAGCAPVRRASLDSGAYESATRLLRRHKVPFAGIPTATGRVILTRSTLLAGDEVEREDLALVVAELINGMPPGSKISVSSGKRAQEEKKTTVTWTDVGSTTKNMVEQGVVRARFGCAEVVRRSPGASAGNVVMWSVSHLKPDELLALHLALGIRVWGRGNESSTVRGATLDVAA